MRKTKTMSPKAFQYGANMVQNRPKKGVRGKNGTVFGGFWCPRGAEIRKRNPMKNNQQEPDTRTLWGLKKIPLTNKPKEEGILDTVTRIVTRIQNDERNCLWPNIHTKPVYECHWPSRKIWPPSVTDIELMRVTSWDVPLWSSSLTSNRIPIRPLVICFSEVTLGYPSDITPI